MKQPKSKDEKIQELREEQFKGQQAEAVLKNPLVQDYFDRKRQTIVHNLQTAKWDDTEEQQELIRILRLLLDFENDFKETIRTGNNANSLLRKIFDQK